MDSFAAAEKYSFDPGHSQLRFGYNHLGFSNIELSFSKFDGTFYVGLLIGLTLLFGVVAELTLLPLLILYFYKRPPVPIPAATRSSS